MKIDLNASVGRYCGISRDRERQFPNGRVFRLLLYGAIRANGMYGTEYNGIAVLDVDNDVVVCDGIAAGDTGYHGPRKSQTEAFDRLVAMEWDEFREFVNEHEESRCKI